MKKKKKRIKSKRKLFPDEVHNVGPFTLARYGKFTLMQNNLTEKGHKAFIKKAADNYGKIVSDIDRIVDEIRSLVTSVNPVHLLYINYFDFLIKNSNIKSEHDLTEDQIISLRMIDYVQSIIASASPQKEHQEITEDFIKRLKEKLTELYRILGLTFPLSLSAVTELNSKKYNYTYDSIFVQAMMLWVNVRGNRYYVHNIPHLSDLLTPHNEVFKELFNITITEFLNGLDKIQDSLSKGFAEAQEKRQTINDSIFITPEEYWNKELLNEKLKEHFENNLELKVRYLEALDKIYGADLFDVKKITGWPDNLLKELSWEPGEGIDFFKEGEFKGWPLRIEPIKLRPFLRFNNEYFCFESTTMMDNIYRIIQRIILKLKPSYKEEWNLKQKNISEQLPIKIFKQILPGAESYQSIFYEWFPDNSGKREWQETDGIIIFDDHLIVIEVKAGAFTYTSPANDFPAYIESVKNLLLKPAKQSLRFINYLNSVEHVGIYNSKHELITNLSKSKFRHTTACCVTIDNFTTLAAKAESLAPIGIELKGNPIWSISLDELRIYKDIFTSPYIFLHFLEERKRAFLSSAVHVDDEIDHIGLYLTYNRYASYAEDLAKDSIEDVHWDGYRKDIDEYYSNLFTTRDEIVVPSQDMPPLYKSIISIANKKGGAGYAKAISILLDLGGNERILLNNKVQDLLSKQTINKRPLPLNYSGYKHISFFARQDIFDYPNHDWIIDYAYKNILGAKLEELLMIILDYKDNVLVDVDFEFIKYNDIPKNKTNELQPTLEKRFQRLKENYLLQTGQTKIGRNDHCPCGSDKKYKNCHGK